MKYISLKYSILPKQPQCSVCGMKQKNQPTALHKFNRHMCMMLFRQHSQRNPCQCCGGSLLTPSTPQGQSSNSAAHSGNWRSLSEDERGQPSYMGFSHSLGQRQKKLYKVKSVEVFTGPSKPQNPTPGPVRVRIHIIQGLSGLILLTQVPPC